MNEFAGYAHPIPGGRWWAMIRFARDARPKPIMAEGDKPQVFPDELAATKAALHHVLAYFNGKLVCSGEIAGGSVKEAKFAAADRKLFRGTGKVVEVENKGAAA
ncbi:hypothetical protein [Rhizobium phaseoli]|uniref:DUF2188 domain-containing protein n=1 Tax=Rhizobium phaseoli TaxID=396 RepID=A0ABN4QJQ1_9HYPH|nr:hypothetical protein [Rhizobium phaseoli]ANL84647.1 hypothetical protein AMC81_CH01866 [Rhizobium phaseoli]ANL91154.1 hypothetical protein AMC80_CH01866 [Rhizobium phaseoli]